jgi:hypothetical protein
LIKPNIVYKDTTGMTNHMNRDHKLHNGFRTDSLDILSHPNSTVFTS